MDNPTEPDYRIACVVLVDERGRVLLQERDSQAPKDPDVWGLVGGHLEHGEGHETAAYRELQEETGVELAPGDLTSWREVTVIDGPHGVMECSFWFARTRLGDADIDCHEGRQIVFVDPAEVASLDRAAATARLLDEFLASPEFEAVRG